MIAIACFVEFLAFYGCVHLVEVDFQVNPNFRVIRERCWEGCASLLFLALPDGVQAIQARSLLNHRNSGFHWLCLHLALRVLMAISL